MRACHPADNLDRAASSGVSTPRFPAFTGSGATLLDNAWGSSGIIEGTPKNTDTLVIEPNGTAVIPILRRDYDVMGDMIFSGVPDFSGVLKTEGVGKRGYRTSAWAKADVFDYIECCYNPIRRHSVLGTIGSIAFELESGVACMSLSRCHATGSRPLASLTRYFPRLASVTGVRMSLMCMTRV